MHIRQLVREITIVLIVTGMSGLLWAQDSGTKEKDPAPLVLRSTTRLVQVSVIVHRKGEPVSDLTKNDFAITDDGKPQNIAQFSMDSVRGVGNGASSTAKTTLPAGIFANRVEDRTAVQAGLSIILLDMLNTRPTDQLFARQQLVKFLGQAQPHNRIALYTLDTELRVVRDFRADSAPFLGGQATPPANYSDRNLATSTVPGGSGHDSRVPGNSPPGQSDPSVYSDSMGSNSLLGTLRTLRFLASHVAHIPGRKNLIWVSSAFPLWIGDSIPGLTQQQFNEEIELTIGMLNSANLAVYPVDPRGLQGPAGFSAESRNREDVAKGFKFGPPDTITTMRTFADRTGGHAYFNDNRLSSAINSAVNDTLVTYTLGYYPQDEKFDRKFHRLKVKVTRPGVEVRYREGYLDVPEQSGDENARKAELEDAVWSPINATGLSVVVKVVPKHSEPDSLQVAVAVDPKDVNLEHQGANYNGHLDILFVQTDEHGKQYGLNSDAVDLHLTEEQYKAAQRSGLRYGRLVTRLPRATELKVVARDAVSGNLGTLTIPLAEVPADR